MQSPVCLSHRPPTSYLKEGKEVGRDQRKNGNSEGRGIPSQVRRPWGSPVPGSLETGTDLSFSNENVRRVPTSEFRKIKKFYPVNFMSCWEKHGINYRSVSSCRSRLWDSILPRTIQGPCHSSDLPDLVSFFFTLPWSDTSR